MGLKAFDWVSAGRRYCSLLHPKGGTRKAQAEELMQSVLREAFEGSK
jgi:hypothetical protein